MEWYWTLLLIVLALVLLFTSGLPVAFSFLLFNCVGAFLVFGGQAGLQQFMLGMVSAINRFALISLPLFILMGSILFEAGIAPKLLDVAEKWTGKMPGRLSIVTVVSGAIFGAMSGSTMAATTVLGTSLLPEMLRRGYHKHMAVGPIMGSAGLSMIIPPSGMGIILASTANVSIAALFVSGYLPGITMALLYCAYILISCLIRPQLAPTYEVPHEPLGAKIVATLKGAIPVIVIIFAVMGTMFLGIATPSEAAATGALAAIILALCYRTLTRDILIKALRDAAMVTAMMLMILLGASAFGQIVSYTGVLKGLSDLAIGLNVSPIVIHLVMVAIVIVMGMFMDDTSIIMITIPVFMPVIRTLGVDPLWFCMTILMALVIGGISPPFGMVIFTMKGVAPANISLADIYMAGIPFCILNIVNILLVVAFPILALWLPNLMGTL